MDLPILNQLEKIYPSQDRGYEAIRKLVKNQNLIEQGIKEIDGMNDLDEIRKQINDLNDDRGYLKTKSLSFNLAIKNGKYIMTNDTDCPDGSTNSTWLIDVTQMNDVYVLQEAFCLHSPIGNTGRKYHRYMVNKVWQAWEPIATTTKTSFLCTAVSGYTITSQNCYMMNGIPHVKISITKTDGGAFGVGNHIIVATLPFSSSNTPLSFAGSSGGYWSSIGCAMVSGTYLVATINTSNTTQIVISGVIV